MKILLISPPVSTPTVMPYSLAMLKAELCSKLEDTVVNLDLNSLFHLNEFQKYYERLCHEKYFPLLEEFLNTTRSSYPQISKDVIAGRKPQGFDLLLKEVVGQKPDAVGISLTYNSQIFFAKALIEELTKVGIKVVLGGPADYSKIIENTTILPSAEKFVEYLVELGATRREIKLPVVADFSDFRKEHYFTRELVFPLRTSQSCPYKLCTFCTHHGNRKYEFMNLELLKEAVIKNNMKKVCLIDDDIPPKRLLEIAAIFKGCNVTWWCQLRPLKHWLGRLEELYSCGLRSIAWGTESGCQRVLDLMQKGTIVEDVEKVLKESSNVGIKNMAYILFGLPGETKEEFMQTVEFLEKNDDSIAIVSASVFGLQQGSRIFANPEQFGVLDVKLSKRTYLGDKVSYVVNSGLSNKEAKVLKKKMMPRILKINSVPAVIAKCKEQVLNLK